MIYTLIPGARSRRLVCFRDARAEIVAKHRTEGLGYSRTFFRCPRGLDSRPEFRALG